MGWHLTIKTVDIVTWVSCGNVSSFILALRDSSFKKKKEIEMFDVMNEAKNMGS